MFPSEYFSMFPAFPENDRVFVAMPFSGRFSLRWEHVIEPAIRGAGLDPYRVDLSKISDSIPVKILRDIGTCRLVFADITTENGVRNPNVMYEVGIAHAIRRQEEVIVFRSDRDELPFDIAPIFAESYDPDGGPGASARAIDQIKAAVQRSLESIDLTRHLIVKRIVDSLDAATFEFLANQVPTMFPGLRKKVNLGKEAGNPRVAEGLSRMLAHGVLKTKLPDFIALIEKGPNQLLAANMEFELSPLGAAVAEEFNRRYYGGRTILELRAAVVRSHGIHLIAQGKATQADIDQLAAEAATASGKVWERLQELISAPSRDVEPSA